MLDPVSYFGVDPEILRARHAANKGIESRPAHAADGHVGDKSASGKRALMSNQPTVKASADAALHPEGAALRSRGLSGAPNPQ